MPVFTKLQPKDGERILHCGHLDRRGKKHFFKSDPVTFDRPDGTSGQAEWWVCCQRCFDRKGMKFDVRGDDLWVGNDPVIEVNPDVN